MSQQMTVGQLKQIAGGAVGQVITIDGTNIYVVVELVDAGARTMRLYPTSGYNPNLVTIAVNTLQCILLSKEDFRNTFSRRWNEIAALYPAINY